MKTEQRTIYVSPKAETTEIKTQAIICQSWGNKSMSEIELDEDEFESI